MLICSIYSRQGITGEYSMKLSKKQQKNAIASFAKKAGWSIDTVKTCSILRYKAFAAYVINKKYE